MTDRITKAIIHLEEKMVGNLKKADKCCKITQRELGTAYVANAEVLRDVVKAFKILRDGEIK